MSKERKVLFVHDGPRFKDNNGVHFGGTADIDMLNRYRYFGDKVSFLMRVKEVSDTSKMVNLNEKDLFIVEVPSFNRPKLLINYFKAKKIIRQTILENDLIIIRLPSTIGSVAYRIAIKLKKPVLVEVVACPWDSLSNYSLLGKFYAPFARLKLKKIVKRAPFVTYVTNEFLQRRYPTSGTTCAVSDVMLNPVNADVLEKKLIRYEKLNNENFSKLSLTTLAAVDVKYKGHHLVLEIINEFKKNGIHVVYNIAGKGDFTRLKNIIRELDVEDNINFIGAIDHKDVFRLLDETDIYIQPSMQEGLPRALVEAMSRGCACIGSDVGGIPELLASEAIFLNKDSNDLMKKIKSFLNLQVLKEQSSKNFEKAKKFQKTLLDAKRKQFYNDFLAGINEK